MTPRPALAALLGLAILTLSLGGLWCSVWLATHRCPCAPVDAIGADPCDGVATP